MKAVVKSAVVHVLTWEAKLLLRRVKPKVVAITGSVGKTSTKDAIYSAIKDHVRARKSEKSFNSEIGVPLSILGLANAWNNPFLWIKNMVDGLLVALLPGQYPDVLVLEVGVDRPGDMAALTQWLKPDVVVLTRLPDVPVHVEYFDTPEAVTAEKLRLVEALKPEGVLVYNHDDEQVRTAAEAIRQQAIGYSRYSESHYHATEDVVSYEDGRPTGLSFALSHVNEKEDILIADSVGVPHVYAYAAAAAVAGQLGVPLAAAASSLKSHVPTAGRMRLLPGLKDTIIIDDTYNSSPTAAERAVQTLKEMRAAGRKIAVVGDMLELGQFSVREHEKLGEQVAHSADILVTIGVRARKVAESALDFGLSEEAVFQYDEVKRASNEVQGLIQAGDIILVKASQGIRAEKLVEEIMAHPEQAETLLVRQSPAWSNR